MDYLYDDNYLMHYGVKGMKWGKRKAKYEYTYAYGQKPKNAYQKVARSLGGTNLAKGAIKISGMSDAQKKNALKEQAILADEKAYNKAAKKAHETGGQMTYDVATGKYSVSKPAKADALTPKQIKKTVKTLEKQYGRLEDGYVYTKKTNAKDLERAYGQIEDSLTYNKRSNKKANEYAEKALMEIDKQLSQTGKKPTYNAEKVNAFIDKALQAIEDDLNQYNN